MASAARNIYVLPSVAPGDDPLLRETIVYLTCLHESGHAFGLAHTHNFADIMYSFQYGGDIAAYFGRYRARLKTRADIAGIRAFRTRTVRHFGDEARLQVGNESRISPIVSRCHAK